MAEPRFSLQDLLRGFVGFDGSGAGGSGSGSGSDKPQWSYPSGPQSEASKKLMKRLLRVVLIIAIPVLLLCYWWFHPPINVHSSDTWVFIALFILLPLYLWLSSRSRKFAQTSSAKEASASKSNVFKYLSFIPILVVAAGLVGALLSATFFPGNAEKYAAVLNYQDSDFSADIKEVNYSEIPVIDRDSAAILGTREMGAIPDYVSQFEISPLYSQINYQGKPVRVSPLNYADIIKWFNNRDQGIPGFLLVDMSTQDAEIMRLDEGVKYSQSEPFMRNVDRHVQLSFPFYMFDEISFEIDEDGHPWWVCPVQKRTIGLFGGTTIQRVVLCDAITGECIDYAIEDCPQWVDRAYPAELLIEQYNWRGAYSQGWINSWLGQELVVQTTPGTDGLLGYNYIAKDDDVWVYTGVTSATADNSIVGFVLINQRTAEAHYYQISGATEATAMQSAEGQVQDLGYQATFPLLLNINSQPTYFMALKDSAGFVKQYAMIDIQRSQNVAIGDTLEKCQETYLQLLRTNGVAVDDGSDQAAPETTEVTGVINRISTAVIDGNSHFYVMLEGDSNLYDCALPAVMDVLMVEVGSNVTISFSDTEGVRVVSALTLVGTEGAAGAGGAEATGAPAASAGAPA